MKRAGRRKPYTDAGVRRLRCVRCSKPSHAQWNACADGGMHRPSCQGCDIDLNRLALEFMRDPDVDAKMDAYVRKLLGG